MSVKFPKLFLSDKEWKKLLSKGNVYASDIDFFYKGDTLTNLSEAANRLAEYQYQMYKDAINDAAIDEDPDAYEQYNINIEEIRSKMHSILGGLGLGMGVIKLKDCKPYCGNIKEIESVITA